MATTPRRRGAVADRAKLDKENFWLHKFRATFATRCLWAGVDLRTVQQWLGHSEMESTMRYLESAGTGEGERDFRLERNG
jgi:site-specific recombinase XerD